VESGKKYNRQKFKRGDKEWHDALIAGAPHKSSLHTLGTMRI
jgi:hypothetical protein